MPQTNNLDSLATQISESRKVLEEWDELLKTLRGLCGYKRAAKAEYMRDWRSRRREHISAYRSEYRKRPDVIEKHRSDCRRYYHENTKLDPIKLEKARHSTARWAKANPEKRAAAARNQRAKDPEKFNTRARQAYQQKSEEERKALYQARREYQKEYRKKNADRLREKKKLWYAAKDKTELRERSRQRYTEKKAEYIARAEERLRKLSERGSHTQEDIDNLYKTQKGKCAACSTRITVRSRRAKYGYEVDHVEPIALGGSNNPDNLQLLCRSCNRAKHSMSPEKWAKRIGKLFV